MSRKFEICQKCQYFTSFVFHVNDNRFYVCEKTLSAGFYTESPCSLEKYISHEVPKKCEFYMEHLIKEWNENEKKL